MQFTDILSFCFSILGLYGLVYYLRFLIPRNLLPYVSAALTDAEHLLDRAESTGVIPRPNDYRSALTFCATSEFLQIRMESHRAPGILRQLWLAVWYGLTCRLFTLSSRVEAIKIKIELAMDERQLISLTDTQSTTATALPTLTNIIVMTNDTAEPHPASPPDATS